MSQFKKFKEKFEEIFEKENAYYEFIECFEEGRNPLSAELKENNDNEEYDSYGSEDSVLNRVFYFPEFDIFVQFLGTRQSHVGEEWNSMQEVKPVTKTINTYE